MRGNRVNKREVALLMGVGIAAIGIWCYTKWSPKVRVGVSGVDGRGIITNNEVDKGDALGLMKNGSLTQIGKNVNHSRVNNAKIEKNGDAFSLMATHPIDDNEEVFINYELNPIGFSTDTRGFQ